MLRIFAISGNGTGAGKTYFAKKTADQVYSVAGALRGELSKVYPRYDWYRTDQDYKETTIVHEAGRHPETGEKMTVRDVLVHYGQTKFNDNPYYWIDKLVDHIRQADSVADGTNSVAIDDVRKLVELDTLKEAFPGRVIHIHILGSGAKEESSASENDELHAICDYEVTW